MNNAKINKITLSNIQFKLNVDEKYSVQLKVQTESRIYPPKDKNDKTAMLMMKATIADSEDEDININVTSNIIFEFDNVPEDYNQVAKDICLPLAQNAVFKKIDDVLEIMGYPKFNITV